MSFLKTGISPCPNDTFMFDAILNHRINTEGLDFDYEFEDVETLNLKAFKTELDLTKLSFHAYLYLSDKYVLLDAGSALGRGCGPLLISNRILTTDEILEKNLKIAIPGKYTTANFLFDLYCPNIVNKKEYVFSEIENAVLSGEVDAGVIIHENRFTYQTKGLKNICDLGEYWESISGLPIPLGGIVIRRDIHDLVQWKMNRLMKKSIEYAFANPKVSEEFVLENSQDKNPEIVAQHIKLYVNEFSIDLGSEGKKAVQFMFDKFNMLHPENIKKSPLFISEVLKNDKFRFS